MTGDSLFSTQTRARALEVMGDTDGWRESDWRHAAISLASAVVAVSGDIDKLPRPDDWSDYHEFRKRTDDPPYGQGLPE